MIPVLLFEAIASGQENLRSEDASPYCSRKDGRAMDLIHTATVGYFMTDVNGNICSDR
jgi:hypothetical protein